MGFVSLSEDALDRWLQDAFLQLNSNPPPPALVESIRSVIQPRFLEIYTHVHVLTRELHESRAVLEAEQKNKSHLNAQIAPLQKRIGQLQAIIQDLEQEVSVANQAAAQERIHVEQLRARLSKKDRAEAEAARLREQCVAHVDKINALEAEAVELRKLAMTKLFGKNG